MRDTTILDRIHDLVPSQRREQGKVVVRRRKNAVAIEKHPYPLRSELRDGCKVFQLGSEERSESDHFRYRDKGEIEGVA